MAWNVDVQEIIKRWVGETPDSDDVLLTTLISDSVILIKQKVKNIDDRLITEPDLQTLLNIVVSKMVQRAYNSDYTGFTSVSNAVGPQSASYSKTVDEAKQGLYITVDELNSISGGNTSDSRIRVLSNPPRPNFYARNGWWGDEYGYGTGWN